MFLGFGDMLFIMLLALLIFGPKKLPEIGRIVGKAMAEFRKASTDLQRSINVELALGEHPRQDPPRVPPPPLSAPLPTPPPAPPVAAPSLPPAETVAADLVEAGAPSLDPAPAAAPAAGESP